MLGRVNQMSIGNSTVDADVYQASVLSGKKTVVVGKYALCVRTDVKGRQVGGKVIMKVLSGSVSYCKQDQSNFEDGKRSIPKSTAPVIYKHSRDRELLAGASAKGRSKTTSDLSVHTHKQAQEHTPTLPALLRNTLTGRDTHIPLKTRSL